MDNLFYNIVWNGLLRINLTAPKFLQLQNVTSSFRFVLFCILTSIKTIVISILSKATIHGNDLPTDELGNGETEKDYKPRHFFRFTDTAHGGPLYHRFEIRLVFQHRLREFGIDVPGSDTVHADSVQAPFAGQVSGQLVHRCLGGGVGCARLHAGDPRHRSDVDDGARRFTGIALQERVALHGEIPHGIEIGLPYGFRVLFGVFNGRFSDVHSYVVHEYIQTNVVVVVVIVAIGPFSTTKPILYFGKQRIQSFRGGDIRTNSCYVEALLVVPFFCDPRQVLLVSAANQYPASFLGEFLDDSLIEQ